jgi:hypothetical protein
MAGLLMLTPQDVVEQRRAAGVLDGEDAEAFQELGNVLYSGIGNVLREQVAECDVRQRDHGVVQALASTRTACSARRRLVVCDFAAEGRRRSRRVGGRVARIDLATAEALEQGAARQRRRRRGRGRAGDPRRPTRRRRRAAAGPDEPFDSIPEAPIRGTPRRVRAADPKVLKTSCAAAAAASASRLASHNRVEVPNPASHTRRDRGASTCPRNEERRVRLVPPREGASSPEWVVLLLHRPSRQSVDAARSPSQAPTSILGLPCAEAAAVAAGSVRAAGRRLAPTPMTASGPPDHASVWP